MTITGTAWEKYINALRQVNDAAADKVRKVLERYDINNLTPATRQEIINWVYEITATYSEASAEMACQMYDAISEASGVNVPPAEPAPIPEYKEVAIATNGTLKTKNPDVVAQAASRLVKRSGVDTTMNNAIRDGAVWAWIPIGDTCAFCRMLASRGWQKASKKAMRNGHAEHIHANCDCTYAISHKGGEEYSGIYAPDKYREEYEEAKDGRKWEYALNSMRREDYSKNKDMINTTKRAAYAKKRITELSDSMSAKLMDNYEDFRVSNGLKLVSADDLKKSKLNPVKADFTGIDTRTAETFSHTLSDLMDEYESPLQRVTVMDKKVGFLQKTVPASTGRDSRMSSASMELNPVVLKDHKTYIDRVKSAVDRGQYPKISDGKLAQYVPTHEFVHTLLTLTDPLPTEKINWSGMDYTKTKKARRELLKLFDDYQKELSSLDSRRRELTNKFIFGTVSEDERREILFLEKTIKELTVSKYASTSADEFVAEAFTDARIGESPGRYSLAVEEILKKYFGKGQ